MKSINLYGQIKQKGYSLIPMSLYFKGNFVKVELGIGKGKGLFDENGNLTLEAKTIYEEIRKRDKILEHDIPKQMSRIMIDSVYVPTSFRGIS